MAFHCLSIILFCGEAQASSGDLETGSLRSSNLTSPAGDGGLPSRVSEQANGKSKRRRMEPQTPETRN